MIEKFEKFEDIKCPKLRARNRAIVMANIWEDHSDEKTLSKEGTGKLFGYFAEIPAIDQSLAFEAFKNDMESRGYVYGG